MAARRDEVGPRRPFRSTGSGFQGAAAAALRPRTRIRASRAFLTQQPEARLHHRRNNAATYLNVEENNNKN